MMKLHMLISQNLFTYLQPKKETTKPYLDSIASIYKMGQFI